MTQMVKIDNDCYFYCETPFSHTQILSHKNKVLLVVSERL